MSCIKNTKAFKLIEAASNQDVAFVIMKKYNIKPDSIPFQFTKDGKKSKLFQDIEKDNKSRLDTIKTMLKIRSKVFKDLVGDWEINPNEYIYKLDINGEPIYKDIKEHITPNLSTIDTERIDEPDMSIEGLSEQELDDIINWGESYVMKLTLNNKMSELELMRTIEEDLQKQKKNLTILSKVLKEGDPKLDRVKNSLEKVTNVLKEEGFKTYSELLKSKLKASGFKEKNFKKKKAVEGREDNAKLTEVTKVETLYEENPLIEEIWDDRKKLSIPLSDTTTFLFKSFLMNIPAFRIIYNEKGEPKREYITNVLEKITTYDHSTVFNKVIEELADFDGSVEESIGVLKNSDNPMLISVAERLDDTSNPRYNQMRNAFTSIRNVQRHNIKTIKKFAWTVFDNGEDIEISEYRTIDTNANSIRREALQMAQSNQIASHMNNEGILEEKNGVLVLSKTKLEANRNLLNKLEKEYNSIVAKTKIKAKQKGESINYRLLGIEFMKRNADTFIKLLNDVGFDIDKHAYYDLLINTHKYLAPTHKRYKNAKNISPQIMFLASNKGDNFIRSLYSNLEKKDYFNIFTNDTNPLEDRTVKGVLTVLRKQNNNYTVTTFLDSFNNQITDKGLPHYVSQLFKSLKANNRELIESYLQADYTKHNRLIKYFNKQIQYVVENTNIGMIEALSSDRKAFQRQDGTEEEKLFLELMQFANNGKGNKEFNIASITPLVFSDKKRNIVFDLPKIDIDFDNKNSINVLPSSKKDNRETPEIVSIKDARFLEAIEGILKGEIERINKVEELQYKKKLQDKGEITKEDEEWINFDEVDKNWLQHGNKFYLFPSVNKVLERYKENMEVLMSPKFLKEAVAEIVKDINEEYQQLIREADVIGRDKIMAPLHAKYVKKLNGGTRTKNFHRLLIDYAINHTVLSAEVMQLFADPAQLDKGKGHVAMMRDYFKRLAGAVGTGVEGNYKFTEKVDGKEIKANYSKIDYIIVKDAYTNRYEKAYLKRFNEAMSNAYSDVVVTDAQEFTTLKEHITDLYAHGKIADELYNSINNKILKSYKNNKDIELNDEELMAIVPRKPLYYGMELNPVSKSMDITYVKSSSFPLIPQYTKGLEIDSLRQKMESIERNNLISPTGEIKDGIKVNVRLAFESAVKIGAKNKQDIYKKDNGKVIGLDANKINKLKPQRVNRKGFKIQQEEGTKHDYEVLTVSQMNALIVNGILEFTGFAKHAPEITGKQIKEEKENIKKQLMQIGKQELFDELGIVDGKFTSIEKLRNYLKDNIESTKITKNELQALKIVDGALAIPLDFTYFSGKIMSTINAAINKKILRPKIKGSGFVQGSSLGVKKAEDINKSNIIASEDWDGTLKNTDFNEDGTIKNKMQVLLPWVFDEPIENFTKQVNGKTVLDFDKIDKDLLSIIGARIPNQGHSSMANIEIVGFLPKSMHDLIILPDEITAQMGSDFDVDHLFTYMYNSIKDENGKLAKLTKDNVPRKKDGSISLELTKQILQNKYVELHDIILSHPKVVEMMLKPLDMDDAVNLAKEIKKIEDEKIKDQRFVPTGRRFVNREYASAQAGKQGVAIEANASVLLTTIQDLGIIINDSKGEPIQITIGEGENNITLDRLGLGHYTVEEGNKIYHRSNADTISMLLTEAVDNAKKGNLFYLGYSSTNSSVYNLLAFLTNENKQAIPLKTISLIMLQEGIQSITRATEKANSMFKDKERKDDIQIIKDHINKYRIERGLNEVVLTDDILLKALKEPEGTTLGQDEYGEITHARVNYTVASLYGKFYNAASDLNIANSVFKVETKGVGKDAVDILNKKTIVDEVVLGSKYVENLWKVLYKDVDRNELTEIGYMIKNSVDLSIKLWGGRINGMPLNIGLTSKFARLRTLLQEANPNLKRNQLNSILRIVYKGFKSYVATMQTSQSNLFKEDGVQLDLQKLNHIYKYGDNRLVDRITEYIKSGRKEGLTFLKALKLDRSADKNKPSEVKLNTFKLTQYSEDIMAASWYSMFNGDNYTRQLALDLVRYAILEGANFDPLSIKKVLPNKALIDLGYGKGLNNIEIEGLEEEHIFKQIVQNNPTIVDNIDNLKEKKFINKKKFTSFYVPNAVNGKDQDTPTYVHKRLGTNNKLYTITKKDEYHTYYSEISTLNNEYYGGKTITKTKQKQDIRDEKITNNKPIENIYFTQGLEGRQALVTAIKNVTSPKFNAAKAVLLSLQELIPNDFKVLNENINSRGLYDSRKKGIAFNTKVFFNSSDNVQAFKEEMEEVLLHEAMHVITGNLASAYSQGKLEKHPINIQMKLIDDVRKYLIEQNAEEYKLYQEARTNGKLTDEQRAKFEPLKNMEEFMVAITNPTFMEHYKDVEYKNKTVGSKLKEYLLKLFNKILGGKLKEGTALYTAFNEFLSVMDTYKTLYEEHNKKKVAIKEKGKVKVDNYNITVFEDGSMKYGNGKLVTDTVTKNKALVKLNYNPKNIGTYNRGKYYVLEDGRIISLQDSSTGKEVFNKNDVGSIKAKKDIYQQVKYGNFNSSINIETIDKYDINILKNNPNKIYIFGDNLQRKGKGGQAIIRDEENAFGIATKKKPSNTSDSFMTDSEYEQNIKTIDEDINKIKQDGRTIVFPKDGIGTGLAKLKEKAPKTYNYLIQRLKEEFNYNNGNNTEYKQGKLFTESNIAKQLGFSQEEINKGKELKKKC